MNPFEINYGILVIYLFKLNIHINISNYMEIKYSHKYKKDGLFANLNYYKDIIIYRVEDITNYNLNDLFKNITNLNEKMENIGIYMNHSNKPNTQFKDNLIITINNINNGDEFTIDFFSILFILNSQINTIK